MIKSFGDRETELLFQRIPSRKLPHTIQRIALRKLTMLDAATSLQDLMVPPGNHLEKLKKARQDMYSIRMNDQWRIQFHWKELNAYDVEIIDYH